MLKHIQVNDHGLIPNYIRECNRMFTHNQVGINCVIKYMQSNIKRISPAECFQKAGTASPGFTRFIFG